MHPTRHAARRRALQLVPAHVDAGDQPPRHRLERHQLQVDEQVLPVVPGADEQLLLLLQHLRLPPHTLLLSAGAGPHLPRLACLEAAPAGRGWQPPASLQLSRPACAARRHSIVDDGSWYFTQNYKAQGGMEKEVDFGIDEALAA